MTAWCTLVQRAHLRELKALIEIEKEDWAAKMQRCCARCDAANSRASGACR